MFEIRKVSLFLHVIVAPTLFRHPDTLTIIRNTFFPSPSRRQKFPPWGKCGSFLKGPIIQITHIIKILDLVTQNITLFMYQFLQD